MTRLETAPASNHGLCCCGMTDAVPAKCETLALWPFRVKEQQRFDRSSRARCPLCAVTHPEAGCDDSRSPRWSSSEERRESGADIACLLVACDAVSDPVRRIREPDAADAGRFLG